jgi:hypothetical protein
MNDTRRTARFLLVFAAGFAAFVPSPAAAEPLDDRPTRRSAATREGILNASGVQTASSAASPESQPSAQTPAPPQPATDPDRTDFTLQLEDGGTVTGSSGPLEFLTEKLVQLTGGVEIHYRDLKLVADSVDLDLQTRIVRATGHVVLDQGPKRLTGQTLELDLDKKTGRLTQATAFVDPDIYFTGAVISKLGDNLYSVEDGIFTSCEGEVPAWSFKLASAEIEVEGYARVKHASFRIKKVPVLYTPYIVWPTKRDRATGFLVPNMGYSDRKGTYLGLAYFKEIGRSYDTTFFLDGYTEGFVGIGNEFRYRPTEGTRGQLETYFIRDPKNDVVGEDPEWRWKVDLTHETKDLPAKMRGVLDIHQFSDFQFFQDFERDFDRSTRRFLESKGFVTGNWGAHGVNVTVSERETFDRAGDSNLDRQLPDVSYRLRQTRLGNTPLYLKVDSSLSYFSVDRSETYQETYGRADLLPTLSLPLEPFPWLSLSVNAGGRFTWWQDSLETDTALIAANGSEFSGESLSRSQPFVGATLVGPSFSKIFESGSLKLKHLIEPRITYAFAQEFEDQSLVPSFDEVDRTFSGHTVRVALINRIKAKAKDDPTASARDVFSLELAQSRSLDDARPLSSGLPAGGGARLTSVDGPIDAVVRFDPLGSLSVRSEWTYDTLFDQLVASAVAANWHKGPRSLDLRWTTRYRANDGEKVADYVRLGGSLPILPRRLQLQASFNFDVQEQELQEQRYFLDYTGDCYGLRLEVRDYQQVLDPTVVDRRQIDYRLAFTLKNVGTFLDLTGRAN